MSEPKRVEVLYNTGSFDSNEHIKAVLRKIERILDENEGKSFILTLEEGDEIGR